MLRTQVIWWVETKGKTLEEMEIIFYGEKHSDVPDLAELGSGTATLEAIQGGVEQEIIGHVEDK